MRIRSGVFLVIGLFLAAAGLPLDAVSQTPQNDAVEKIQAKVREIGVGANARVEVKIRDKRKLKGHIASATDNAFTVVDAKTGGRSRLPLSMSPPSKNPTKAWAAPPGSSSLPPQPPQLSSA